MRGHPNIEAEESKIQIDTGLFVLLIYLQVQDGLLWQRLLHLRWFLPIAFHHFMKYLTFLGIS